MGAEVAPQVRQGYGGLRSQSARRAQQLLRLCVRPRATRTRLRVRGPVVVGAEAAPQVGVGYTARKLVSPLALAARGPCLAANVDASLSIR